MKLTKEQIENLPKLYSQDGEEQKTAYLHFFNLLGRGDWFALEGQEQPNGDWLFFGYVKSPLGEDCDEYGYFTLNELKRVKVIELDKYFNPTPLSEVIA